VKQTTHDLGAQAEDRGVALLKKLGFKILARNVRTRYGEIDVIAREKRTIVFVEVKSRGTAGFGRPEEAVTARKQGRIVRSAIQYLKENALTGSDVRFDVVAFGPGTGDIEHLRSAFQSPPEYRY